MDKEEEIRRLIINDLYLNMDEDMATDTLERIDEYAQQVSREVAIKFGIWIKENQGRENFDFRRGDSDEYFDEWQQKQKDG